ncbi:hypothetical protein [Ilumatobacter sp.]|uniref:hypothetical protein n=1 Tax=Ilumatobacter sp. TaxID=1967498 RepID=UPI003B523ADF
MSVEPREFSLVDYDADVIARTVAEVATALGVANPIRVVVDETTPLAKRSAELDGPPDPDTAVVLRFQSGALEDSRDLTNFGPRRARLSAGLALLRARDRLRPDFADVPSDRELTNAQNAAWDTYCAGRLARAGLEPSEQQFRYDFRNRFGFTDAVDRRFDEVWLADDLGWSDLLGDD